jgi:hypothetical protein
VRRRVFLAIVRLRRAGVRTDWDTGPTYDRALARRLLPRIVYGGRKGWRAYLQLWKMGVRPGEPVVRRLVVTIKGFELETPAR